MTVDAHDVLDVLTVVTEAGAEPVLTGGWGVEALLGGQHRDHESLTVMVSLEDLDPVIGSLGEVGFVTTFDASPTRLELTDPYDRVVELTTIREDADGHRWQVGADQRGGDLPVPADSLTTGWVAGHTVSCAGVHLQVAQRRGIAPDRDELADLHRLRDRFGVWLPEGFR